MDPGIRTTAALWVAISPENKAYGYREVYAHNEPLYEVAREIKIREGWRFNKELSKKFGHYVWEEPEEEPGVRPAERMVIRLIDPSSQRRSEAGDDPIIARLANFYGLMYAPANNAKREGIESVRYWIANAFQIFNTCENFLDERRAYRIRSERQKRDQNAPIDEPVKSRDHLMDCWRYLAIHNPRYEDRIEEHGMSKLQKRTSEILKLQREAREPQHDYFGSDW